jgi:quercetin dioxygenase-like cupin family protein
MNHVADRPTTHALDAMAMASEHHALLLENGSVRVLDTKVGPGGRTPVHAHEWPAALYVLSWSDFVRYDPEGNVLVDSRNMASKPAIGSALWAAPIGPHFVENVGTTDLHILAVEVKA